MSGTGAQTATETDSIGSDFTELIFNSANLIVPPIQGDNLL